MLFARTQDIKLQASTQVKPWPPTWVFKAGTALVAMKQAHVCNQPKCATPAQPSL